LSSDWSIWRKVDILCFSQDILCIWVHIHEWKLRNNSTEGLIAKSNNRITTWNIINKDTES
jgi:hypothetical protein